MIKLDEKDSPHMFEEEPEKYHIITCRVCGKQKKTFKRFTRTCNYCRTKRAYRVNHTCDLWKAWGGDENG